MQFMEQRAQAIIIIVIFVCDNWDTLSSNVGNIISKKLYYDRTIAGEDLGFQISGEINYSVNDPMLMMNKIKKVFPKARSISMYDGLSQI